MKKRFAIILAVSLATSLLAGCGSKKKETPETTTQAETQAVSETNETKENVTEPVKQTEAETSPEVSKLPVAHEEVGQVYSAKEIYAGAYPSVVFRFDGKEYRIDEYLELTKNKFPEMSTKYRSEYRKDLEALPFKAAYRNDEGNVFTSKSEDELKELALGAAKVAEQFGLLYWPHDGYRTVFGTNYSWPMEEYMIGKDLSFEDAKQVSPFLFTELKCYCVYLLSGSDGTISALVYFLGYGVLDQTLIDEFQTDVADRLIKLELELVYTDNGWKVLNTPETSDELANVVFSTYKNGDAWAWKTSIGETDRFVSIIGEVTEDVKAKER